MEGHAILFHGDVQGDFGFVAGVVAGQRSELCGWLDVQRSTRSYQPRHRLQRARACGRPRIHCATGHHFDDGMIAQAAVESRSGGRGRAEYSGGNANPCRWRQQAADHAGQRPGDNDS
jgi:hypothetical protein